MYLGIEIGGTKLQIGLGPGDGTLRALWRGGVDVARGGEGIREQIQREVPAFLQHAKLVHQEVRGVGVGFGGPVDDADQTVIKSHQVEGWDHYPLARWLTGFLHLPVALGNDADVAGLAEALFGAGREQSPIFYITIGSGIGGGFIIDGKIHRGIGKGAAEIGHLRMAQWTATGMSYCTLEAVASGWSLERTARQRAPVREDAQALIALAGGHELILARHIGAAAAEGDTFSWEILRPAWENLAEAICQVIALLCPRCIVIGGGVALMGEAVLFEPLRALVAERVFEPFANGYDILPATLGEEVVVHGALALARQRFGN